MPDFSSNSVVLSLILLIVGLLFLAFGAWFLSQKREQEWARVARHLKLQFTHDENGPRVHGQWHDRRVEVRVSRSSSDTEAGVIVAKISLEVRGVPGDFRAEATPGIIGDLQQLGEERFVTGDDEFDQNVLIQGSDRNAVVAYWTAPRRAAFLELVNMENYDQLILENRSLVARLREAASDHAQTELMIQQLEKTAIQLDLA